MGATSAHFSAAELACHHCAVNNCTIRLVGALETFRSLAFDLWFKKYGELGHFGVLVNDAYRCVFWNGKTKNASTHSQHVLGNAADIRVPGLTPFDLEAIARHIPEIGGIGRALNYLHIDVRPRLGDALALWCYDKDGRETLYSPV